MADYYATVNPPDLIIHGVTELLPQQYETRMWASKEVTRYVPVMMAFETAIIDDKLRENVGNDMGSVRKPIHAMELRSWVQLAMRSIALSRYYTWKRENA
jgi:hypothetical protein